MSETPFVACAVDPSHPDQICAQIADADCALVSWRTRVDDAVMTRCPSLRHIGLCASKYTNPAAGNVDVTAAARHGVTVTAVGQYGDEATAEFIFCTLLNLCRGFEKIQWQDMPCELHGKRLGVIGMGAMGQHVVRRALGFGMQVSYFSRTRKPECEVLGATYTSKRELLRSSDIVSLHVPKATHILSAAEFALMRAQSVLINTCLGVVFAPEDFEEWIKDSPNFAIMDESCDLVYRQFRALPNVIYPSIVAGRTAESRQRLSAQVLANLEAYLAGRPQNVIS
jgi:lactate dehydrogenase-like 2-hydroxyacid dehydrogenase